MNSETILKAIGEARTAEPSRYPAIGIDIDGCVDEFPEFFRVLAGYWPGKVYVITYREDRSKAEAFLAKFGVRCCELILVNSFEEKALVIAREGIIVFFDDQPEVLKPVAPACGVMLVRNEGNFDFDDRKWMLSDKTGKLV
ncbi:MAG: hypothetical protein ACKO9Z_07780 [Planctomycetota bacterium]|jgi:hypothetical protein